MDNIRTKSETLSNWRSEVLEDAILEDSENLTELDDIGGKTAALIATGMVSAAGATINKFREFGEKIKEKGKKRTQLKTEEVQGGVNVENYADGVQFNEIETVDIIKPSPLNASDWRSELEVVNEGVKYYTGSDRNPNTGLPKGLKSGGGTTAGSDPIEVLKKMRDLGGASAKKTVDPNKNEVISASYEVDLENMVLQIIEEDIIDLYNEGFSYDELVEFYDIEEDLTEAWGLLAKGAFQGAKMLATKVAPKVMKFAAKRGIKDRKLLTKFVRNPNNWARANKDIDKVGKFAQELPARTYAGIQAVNQKLLQPAKNVVGNIKAAKRGGDLAVIRQQIKGNISTNNPRVQAAANKFSNKTTKTTKSNFTQSKVKPELNRVSVTPSQARAAVQPSKSTVPNITGSQARAAVEAGSQKAAKAVLKPKPKHVPRQKITQRGNEELLKLQGKDKKQLKAKELYARMDRAVSSSKKPGTISNKTDKLINQIRNDKGSALVKAKSNKITTTPSTAITRSRPSGSGAITRSVPSGSGITRSTPSGSGITKSTNKTSKIAKAEKPASKTTVDVKAKEVKSGVKSGVKSDKRQYAKDWMAYNKAADSTLRADKTSKIANVAGSGLVGLTAGGKVGQELAKPKPEKATTKSSDSEPPKTESPKTQKAIAKEAPPKGYVEDDRDKNKVDSPDSSKKSENKTVDSSKKDENKTVSKRRGGKVNLRPTGRTKWVGKNSTWTDRSGNVIAPREEK